jgi:BirA family biotin operon repressor/biotin-[acetyl-CoA-carboxylase] ligase
MLEYDVVESTNDQAALLLRQGLDELPLVVWAKTQTKGRGRGSRRWWSDTGSLTFTIAIDPTAHGLEAHHEPKLALVTAVAVIDSMCELEVVRPSVGIRWPNDLEIDELKLGGILPERVETRLGSRLLIGVGLNVGTNLADAPAEVRTMATSLVALGGGRADADLSARILAASLNRLESMLRRLVDAGHELAARWNQLDRLRDRWVRVDQGTSIVAGWGRGIDLDGALCLEDGRQRIRVFGGQVLRLPEAEEKA